MFVDGKSYGSGYNNRIYVGLKIGGVDKGYLTDHYTQYQYGTSWEVYGVKLDGTTISYSMKGTVGAGYVNIQPSFYTATFTADSATYGSVSTGSYMVLPGTTYSVNNNVLTLKYGAQDGRTVTASTKSVSGYTSKFTGWTPTSGTINAATTIKAGFSGTANSYTLTVNPGNSTYTQTYGSTKSISAPASSYKVTLNANGGSCSTTSLTSTGTLRSWSLSGSGSISSTTANPTTYTYAAGNGTLTASYTYGAVTLPTASRTGYTFKGWSTSNTASSGTTGSYTPTGNVTLYAIWQVNSYTLTVNPGNSTYTQNYGTTKSISAPASSYKATLNADGGSCSVTSVSSTGTLRSWSLSGSGSISSTTANPTTYTYGTGAATLTADYYYSAARLPTPTKSGYKFTGWGTSIYFNYDKFSTNKTLGDADGDGSVSVLDLETIQKYLMSSEKTDINVSRADVDGDGKVTYLDYVIIHNGILGISGTQEVVLKAGNVYLNVDLTLKAKWTQSNYTLTVEGSVAASNLYINGVSYEGKAIIEKDITAGSQITVSVNSKNYTEFLSGWYSVTDHKDLCYTKTYTFTMPEKDYYIDFRSHIADTETNVFTLNNEDKSSNSIIEYTTESRSRNTYTNGNSGILDVREGISMTVKATFNNNLSFKGWKDEDGNIVSTANPYTFKMPANDYSLTAVSKPNNYTVTFDYNGNGQTSSTSTVTTGYSTILKTPNDRNLYSFMGWYTSASGGTRVGGAGETYTPTNNITLYAHWSPYKKIFDYTYSSSLSNWGYVTWESHDYEYGYTEFSRGGLGDGGYVTAGVNKGIKIVNPKDYIRWYIGPTSKIDMSGYSQVLAIADVYGQSSVEPNTVSITLTSDGSYINGYDFNYLPGYIKSAGGGLAAGTTHLDNYMYFDISYSGSAYLRLGFAHKGTYTLKYLYLVP